MGSIVSASRGGISIYAQEVDPLKEDWDHPKWKNMNLTGQRSLEPPGLKLCIVSYVYIEARLCHWLTYWETLCLYGLRFLNLGESTVLGKIIASFQSTGGTRRNEHAPLGTLDISRTNNYSCTPLAGTELVLGVLHDLGSLPPESQLDQFQYLLPINLFLAVG